jgi:hypothetical protein
MFVISKQDILQYTSVRPVEKTKGMKGLDTELRTRNVASIPADAEAEINRISHRSHCMRMVAQPGVYRDRNLLRILVDTATTTSTPTSK